MRFWTIQSTSVIEILRQKGFYQPDFSISRFLMKNPPLAELYRFVLNCYNQVNHARLPGLVFAFLKSDNNAVYQFQDADDFYQHMCSHGYAVKELWNQFDPETSVVMELEYPDNFNPLFIDINDFQLLMPPMMVLPPYTEDSFKRITEDLREGVISSSDFPSYIIQAHLPCIWKENVCNLYSFFELE